MYYLRLITSLMILRNDHRTTVGLQSIFLMDDCERLLNWRFRNLGNI